MDKKNLKDDSNNSVIHAIIEATDNKNINDIEKLTKDFNKNNKSDIIFELYNNKLLTSERLQFIMKKCTKYFDISSNLINKLMKDENVSLLDIIFSHLKFYNNEFILQLLLYYKNNATISIPNLIQQISNEKYKISIDFNYSYNKI